MSSGPDQPDRLRRYFAWVLRNRGLTLAVCAVITALAVASASRTVIASSIGKLFLGDMPEYVAYQERSRVFGNDEFFVVAYAEPSPLSAASLERLERVVAEVEAIPDVARATSLLDAARIARVDGALEVTSYAALAADDEAGATAALLADPLYQGAVIAVGGDAAAVAVEMTVDPYRPAERGPALVAEVLGAFEAAGYAPESLHRAGMSALIAEVMEETYYNLERLFPLSVVALLAAVWWLFRRLTPAAVTTGVGLVSVTWTLGFAALIDREFSIFTALVPAVVLTVAFSDIVHLWSAYHLELRRGKPKDAAILASAEDVGRACLLTSATTFIGFLSLAAVPTPVSRQLGLVLGFGVGAALLLAMTLVPVALSYLPEPALRAEEDGDSLDRVVRWCERASLQRPRAVLAVAALLALPLGYGIATYRIGTDFSQRFAPDNDYRQDMRFFEENFDGTNALTVYLQTGGPGGLEDEQLMRRVGAFQDAVETLPEVDDALSPVDVLRRLHTALAVEDGLADEDGLPDQAGAIAQYLFLLEMSGDEASEALSGLMDEDRSMMRMAIRTPESGYREMGAIGDQVAALGASIEGVEVEVTGVAYLLGSYFEDILRGQRAGLLLSLGLISVVMTAGLRSVRAGLLSMLPNLLPLAAVVAVASYTWEAVDSDMLIVLLMAIGIGVDDTIHFLMRYRVEAARAAPGEDPSEPLRRTFRFAGRAILMTTVILCAGFLPFALSDYFSLFILGSFLPLALITAVAADLLLVPALARLGLFRFSRRQPPLQ